MSDAKLRDLERRWKETGSPDDEAAYLLERVRVGDLSRERLELAAYCGHEGASRVFEKGVTNSPPQWVVDYSSELGIGTDLAWSRIEPLRFTYLEDFQEWIQGLVCAHPGAACEAAIAACSYAASRSSEASVLRPLLDDLVKEFRSGQPRSQFLDLLARRGEQLADTLSAEELLVDDTGSGTVLGHEHEIARAIALTAQCVHAEELAELVIVHASRAVDAIPQLRAHVSNAVRDWALKTA